MGSYCVILRLATSEPLVSLLEMQNFEPYLRHAEMRNHGDGAQVSVLANPSGESDAS
jgi:hypothetical protein